MHKDRSQKKIFNKISKILLPQTYIISPNFTPSPIQFLTVRNSKPNPIGPISLYIAVYLLLSFILVQKWCEMGRDNNKKMIQLKWPERMKGKAGDVSEISSVQNPNYSRLYG